MFTSNHDKIWELISTGECLEKFIYVFASFILFIGEIHGLSLKMFSMLPKLTNGGCLPIPLEGSEKNESELKLKIGKNFNDEQSLDEGM